MNQGERHEVKLLKDAIKGNLKRLDSRRTMDLIEVVDLIRLSYTLGRIVGRDEKQKEIALFRKRDPDEEQRGKKWN